MIYFVVKQPECLEHIYHARSHHIAALQQIDREETSTPLVEHADGGWFEATFQKIGDRVYYTNRQGITYEIVRGLPEQLRKECLDVSEELCQIDADGFYRNTAHCVSNLAIALRLLAYGAELSERFNASSSQAQFGTEQPDRIDETLENALRPELHGGIQQSYEAMRKKGNDTRAIERAIRLVKIII